MEAMEAKNGAWRVYRPVVAGSHYLKLDTWSLSSTNGCKFPPLWWGAGYTSHLKRKAGSGSALNWCGSATLPDRPPSSSLYEFLNIFYGTIVCRWIRIRIFPFRIRIHRINAKNMLDANLYFNKLGSSILSLLPWPCRSHRRKENF